MYLFTHLKSLLYYLFYSLQVFWTGCNWCLFLLKSKWQQISSDLLDSSQYSCWSWFFFWPPVQLVCFPGSWRQFLGIQLHLVTASLSFSNSLVRTWYLLRMSPSFIFTLWLSEIAKSMRWQFIFFLLINKSGLLVGIGWSVCFSKSQHIMVGAFHVIIKNKSIEILAIFRYYLNWASKPLKLLPEFRKQKKRKYLSILSKIGFKCFQGGDLSIEINPSCGWSSTVNYDALKCLINVNLEVLRSLKYIKRYV